MILNYTNQVAIMKLLSPFKVYRIVILILMSWMMSNNLKMNNNDKTEVILVIPLTFSHLEIRVYVLTALSLQHISLSQHTFSLQHIFSICRAAYLELILTKSNGQTHLPAICCFLGRDIKRPWPFSRVLSEHIFFHQQE